MRRLDSRLVQLVWPVRRAISWRCRRRRWPQAPHAGASDGAVRRRQAPPATAGRPPPPPQHRRQPSQPAGLRADASDPQPVCADLEAGADLRPVEQRVGDPARFQRYEDLGNGLLVHRRALRARDTTTGCSGSAPTTSAGAISGFSARYERTGRVRHLGALGPDSAVLQRRHPNAVHARARPEPARPRRRRAAAIQNGQADRNAYVPIATQFDLRERRDIGTITAHRDADAARSTSRRRSRRPSTRASCRGAPASASATTSRWRCRTTPARTTSPSAPSGRTAAAWCAMAYDGSWFNNLDDTLIWDSPLRLDDSTSAPGRGRMALWPSNSAQTISAAAPREARAAHAGDRIPVLRLLEQRRAAAALHHQSDAAAADAAAEHDRAPRPTSSRRTSTWSRGPRPTGGSARGSAATTTTTRRRTRPSRSSSTTTRR